MVLETDILDCLMDEFLDEATDLTMYLVENGYLLMQCEDDDEADSLALTSQANISASLPYAPIGVKRYFKEVALCKSAYVFWSQAGIPGWYSFELVYDYQIEHFVQDIGLDGLSHIQCMTCGEIISIETWQDILADREVSDRRDLLIADHQKLRRGVGYLGLEFMPGTFTNRLINVCGRFDKESSV